MTHSMPIYFQSGSCCHPGRNPIVCKLAVGFDTSSSWILWLKLLPGLIRFRKKRMQQSELKILCGSPKNLPESQASLTLWGKTGIMVIGLFQSLLWWAQIFRMWLNVFIQLSKTNGWPSPKCLATCFFSGPKFRLSYIFESVPRVLTSNDIQAGGRPGSVYFDL